MAESLGTAVLTLTADAAPLEAQMAATEAATRSRMARAASTMQAAGTKMVSAGAGLTKGLTLPLAAVGVVAGKMSIDFDRSMRNVNSIAQLPEPQFRSLSDSVLELAGKTAQAPKTLADGLYDLVSSGFDAKESLYILERSAKAATAGLTTTEVSTKAVAAVLNAYRLPASQAGDVSDTLFRTVDKGVISFEALASEIGDVLPFASSLHVPLEDVGASIATMTKAGISAPETMTRIKAVMVAMLKPSKDLSETIHNLGYESGSSMIEALGFQGSLDAIAKATGGSKDEMAKLFPNVRALGGALALTGENSRNAGEDLKSLRDHSGATERALSQQSKSVAFQWQQMTAKLSAAAIKIGNAILPTLVPIVMALADGLVWLMTAFDGLPGPMKTAILSFGVAAALIGPVLMVVGKLTQGLGVLIGVLPRVAAAFRIVSAALMANPYLLLAAATIAIGVLIVTHWSQIRDWLVGAWNWIKDRAAAIWNGLKDFFARWWPLVVGIMSGGLLLLPALFIKHFDKVKGVVSGALGAIVGFVRGLPARAVAALSALGGVLAGVAKSAWALFYNATVGRTVALLEFVGGLPGRILNAVGDLGSLLFDAGKAVISGLIDGVKSMLDDLFGLVGGIADKIASIKGPLPEDRKLLIPHGRAIIEGLQKGLNAQLSVLMPEMGGVAPRVADAVSGVGPSVHNQVRVYIGDEEITGRVRTVIDRVDREKSLAYGAGAAR